MKDNLRYIVFAIAVAIVTFFVGRCSKPNKPAPEPVIIERIDTLTITKVRVDTVERVRTIKVFLPVSEPEDEPMDTIDCPYSNPSDSVMVDIPISRYVAQKDSLYKVVAEGYAVDFKEITVYPKTITITNTVEVKKPTHWGIGVQAGYGATVKDNTVRLSPYVGVGISYNIITW